MKKNAPERIVLTIGISAVTLQDKNVKAAATALINALGRAERFHEQPRKPAKIQIAKA